MYFLWTYNILPVLLCQFIVFYFSICLLICLVRRRVPTPICLLAMALSVASLVALLISSCFFYASVFIPSISLRAAVWTSNFFYLILSTWATALSTAFFSSSRAYLSTDSVIASLVSCFSALWTSFISLLILSAASAFLAATATLRAAAAALFTDYFVVSSNFLTAMFSLS